MLKKQIRYTTARLLFLMALFSAQPIAAETPKAQSGLPQEELRLDWIDLVPIDEQKHFDQLGMPAPGSHDGGKAKQSLSGGVRPELDGSYVKIPGFVIPLEGDQNTLTEFLLVPYFGACIHVPPPPPNQIIYVKFPSGAPVQQLWDVIYVKGILHTEQQSHELAETGYTLQGTSLEEYDDL